jgi:hypothetical protein
MYGLAIFAYVISVSYTIDVFHLGRNAVILVLLASAALMIVMGRQLRQQSKDTNAKRWSAVALGVFIIVFFIISVIFGKLQEQTMPVPVVKASELVLEQDTRDKVPYIAEVKILERTAQNNFFLPVPIKQHNYQGCLVTSERKENLYLYSRYVENQEVTPGETKTIHIIANPITLSKNAEPREILIYDLGEMNAYEYSQASCEEYTMAPMFRIPVQ